MIDPRSQYIIYKEQENERMLQIERKLAAQERGEHADPSQPWYASAGQWLKAKVFGGMSQNTRASQRKAHARV